MEEPKNQATTAVPFLGSMGTPFSKSECIKQYNWGDECHGWTFIDTDALSVKQELMPPDTAEQLHYHEQATQVFFILRGRATFSIDGQVSVLKPEQGIQILPGQQHFITNNYRADLEFILYSYPSTNNDRINCE